MMALLGVRVPGRTKAGGEAAPGCAGTGHRGENRGSNPKQVGLGGGPGGQQNKAPDAGLGRRRRKLPAKTRQAGSGDPAPAPVRRPSC